MTICFVFISTFQLNYNPLDQTIKRTVVISKATISVPQFPLAGPLFESAYPLNSPLTRFKLKKELILQSDSGITFKQHFNQIYFFGPDCAILAYNTLGIYLGMTGEQACEYSRQGLLRELSPYGLVWEAMQSRFVLSMHNACSIQETHCISNQDILLPPIQTLPGPRLLPWSTSLLSEQSTV
ncbi:hypothetical protein K439DRAFT_1613158 [Ramaria rubella]|nr:hypothetical protein K439DRAFT_1613158 [Ramaria rubella]